MTVDLDLAGDREWVPFSERYGLVKEARLWGREHWTGRHADHGIVSFDCCPPNPRTRCGCPGSPARQGCCETATAEDILCDACREHCWAVDDAQVYHRLIDLYQPSTAPQTHPDSTLRRVPAGRDNP